MSDYGDFCREMREARKKYRDEHITEEYLDLLHEQAHNEWHNSEVKHIRKVSQEHADKFIEKLISLGAVFKTTGVYRLGKFDFYPRKSNARDYRTNEFFEQDEALKLHLKELDNHVAQENQRLQMSLRMTVDDYKNVVDICEQLKELLKECEEVLLSYSNINGDYELYDRIDNAIGEKK